MEENNEESVVALTSKAFVRRYNLVLSNLDDLSRGVFDDTAADEAAALALLAEAACIKQLANIETRSRGLKRDIEFAKAKAYRMLKKNPPEGKRLTEPGMAAEVTLDAAVQKAVDDHIDAEKEYKELFNILALLKDAHITFRSIGRKG